MARLLIFVGTSERLREYGEAGFNVLRRVTFNSALEKFHDDENGVLIAGAALGTSGCKVPPGTFVSFDPSWPYGKNDPETVQALARVDRSNLAYG